MLVISILMALALIVNRLTSAGGCIGGGWVRLGLVPKPVTCSVRSGLNHMEPGLLPRVLLICPISNEILRFLVDLMIVAKLAYLLKSVYVHYWHFISAPEVNLTCRSFVLLSHRDFLSVSQSVSLASCPQ